MSRCTGGSEEVTRGRPRAGIASCRTASCRCRALRGATIREDQRGRSGSFRDQCFWSVGLPAQRWVVGRRDESVRIAILASHEGTTLQAVIDACAASVISCQVVAVISNNRESGALQRARAAGIPAYHLSSRSRAVREEGERGDRVSDRAGGPGGSDPPALIRSRGVAVICPASRRVLSGRPSGV